VVAARVSGRVAPLSTVFPWWYLAGAVVTMVVVLSAGGQAAAAIGWGPLIGLVIQDRRKAARTRADEGLPVRRRDLGDGWGEPVTALLLTLVFTGLGLVLHALFAGPMGVALWTGLGLIVTGGAAYAALLLAPRRRPRA